MAAIPPVHDLIRKRWSPRAFAERAIEPEVLESVFEGARWAASSFNEQPWRFLVATRDQPEEFQRMLGVLVPKNQEWAGSAWALGLTAGKKTFSHNGSPNKYGLHDAGAALANLMVQATAAGVQVHAMGGFDANRARLEFAIPEDFEPGAAFAIGYPSGSGEPPPDRSRKPLEDLVFSGGWGHAAFRHS